MHLLHVCGIPGALTGGMGAKIQAQILTQQQSNGSTDTIREPSWNAWRAVASVMLFSGTSVRS